MNGPLAFCVHALRLHYGFIIKYDRLFPSLQRLYVCNNGLSAEAAELLVKILIREASVLGSTEEAAEKKCPPLELLHFYNNMSGDGGAKAVAKIVEACPQLLDFRFSATRSTPVGCESIAAVSYLRCNFVATCAQVFLFCIIFVVAMCCIEFHVSCCHCSIYCFEVCAFLILFSRPSPLCPT